MMEADMKSVSIGTKSKSEVLENCLQQMKACFLDARANKVKLFDAMGTFFARFDWIHLAFFFHCYKFLASL
jgi:DNA topoisomerase-3